MSFASGICNSLKVAVGSAGWRSLDAGAIVRCWSSNPISAVWPVSDFTTPTPYCGWRTFIPIWSVSMFMLLSKSARSLAKAQTYDVACAMRDARFVMCECLMSDFGLRIAISKRLGVASLTWLSSLVTCHSSLSESSDGNDCSRFDGRGLGLVGDQFAQEWNQRDEPNADRECDEAELGEKFRISGICRGCRSADRVGNHPRKVARKQRRKPGPEHPAAHHDALILPRRELADHRVADWRNEQLADALEHVTTEQPRERTLPVAAGQLDAEWENEKGERHQQKRRRELLQYVNAPTARTQMREEGSEQRPAEHDANGVDVLNPLRLNRHRPHHQVDVVDCEQHQAARRHLVERPEH